MDVDLASAHILSRIIEVVWRRHRSAPRTQMARHSRIYLGPARPRGVGRAPDVRSAYIV